ncbi:transposase [Xylocopilactobacillus apicola]|uniref:transposase n=1 Tax=Xylocopilactobacillus apicola TaxID=2932184 RepID=UPI003CE4B169
MNEYSQRVKTIVVDLNAAYVSFIPQIFPNAEIIIDRFHLVQMPNRSVNIIRTKLMRTSYGFRSWENFRLMIYLECGMLKVS